MANWTPNNSQAANSGSLVFWVDANDTQGYRLDGGTRTDQDIGTANTLDVIYNLGKSGSIFDLVINLKVLGGCLQTLLLVFIHHWSITIDLLLVLLLA